MNPDDPYITITDQQYVHEYQMYASGFTAAGDGVHVHTDDKWSTAVASRNGEVVGFLQTPTDGSSGRTVLMVAPQHWRQGIATQLMEALAPSVYISLNQLWTSGGDVAVRRFIKRNLNEPWMDKWSCAELQQHKPECACVVKDGFDTDSDEPTDPTAEIPDVPDGLGLYSVFADGSFHQGVDESASWLVSVYKFEGRIFGFLKVSLSEKGVPQETVTLWSNARSTAFTVIQHLAEVRKIRIDQIYTPDGAQLVADFIEDRIAEPWMDKWTCEELGQHRPDCVHGKD
jgi:GNAT superfamily N-acetyltransferase